MTPNRPGPSLSAAARLLASLEALGEKEAISFGGSSLSFARLGALARRYASSLAARGIRRGDRVAVFAESSADLVVALVGHHLLGAVHVPINTRYREEEAGHILRDSGAAAILYDPASACAAVLSRVGKLPELRLRVALPGPGEEGPGGTGGAHGTGGTGRTVAGPGAEGADAPLPFRALLGEGLPAAASPPRAEPGTLPADSDAALLIYTSGTTGKSKGVELSFRALVANVEAVTGLWEFSASDRLALALPLFHVHGLCLGVHGTLLHGMTALLHEHFDAAAIVEAFRTGGATVFMGVPTMYVRLLERIEADPSAASALSRARLFTAGSAPLPADDFRAFERATGHAILERYGMSETLFTLSNPYRGERRPGTVGLAVPGCQVRIADDAGNEVEEGELGEIVVKSNGMMTGYWGREDETARSFRDGWFLTGDVARRDGSGYATIVGRKSVDVIKSGGFKISAREIEDVLRRHPLVKEVAVVGAPDRVWGQRIVAAVVVPGGTEVEPGPFLAELSSFSATLLADYKRPRQLLVLPELPRNALGKVQKHLVLKAVEGA